MRPQELGLGLEWVPIDFVFVGDLLEQLELHLDRRGPDGQQLDNLQRIMARKGYELENEADEHVGFHAQEKSETFEMEAGC